MSLSKAQYEARRWLETAKEDLEAARALNSADFFYIRVKKLIGAP
jgi:hypothetical protein